MQAPSYLGTHYGYNSNGDTTQKTVKAVLDLSKNVNIHNKKWKEKQQYGRCYDPTTTTFDSGLFRLRVETNKLWLCFLHRDAGELAEETYSFMFLINSRVLKLVRTQSGGKEEDRHQHWGLTEHQALIVRKLALRLQKHR